MRVIEGGRSDKMTTADPEAATSTVALGERGETLVGRIAADISEKIIQGILPAGADLNSVELAKQFGTSRTPVREALMLLEKEGLVEIKPRRRPRVARVSWRDLEEIYIIRAHMNALKLALVVDNASEGALLESRRLFDRMKVAAERGDTDRFVAERKDLHDFWASICGNKTLETALANWQLRLSLRRIAKMTAVHIERSISDHECLLRALESRDRDLAASLIRSMTMAGLDAIKDSGWGMPSGNNS